jgi:endo-1,4-beta-mannosidase
MKIIEIIKKSDLQDFAYQYCFNEECSTHIIVVDYDWNGTDCSKQRVLDILLKLNPDAIMNIDIEDGIVYREIIDICVVNGKIDFVSK